MSSTTTVPLERAPSLTHSAQSDTLTDPSSSTTSSTAPNVLETLVTPTSPTAMKIPGRGGEEKNSRRLGMSKSVGNLKKGKMGGKRERAMSNGASEKPTILSPTSPVSTATSLPKPIRPQARSKESGFSSFLRKLTGRSASPPKTAMQAMPPAPPAARRGSTPQAGRAGPTAMIPPVPRIDTRLAPSIHPNGGPATAPPSTRPAQILSPLVQKPVLPAPTIPEEPKETDPLMIPLPPSPMLSPVVVALPPTIPEDFGLTATSPVSAKRTVKQTGLLSLEGVGDMDEEVQDDDDEEEREELVDTVQPLSVRIPAGGGGRIGGRQEDAVVSPSSAGSEASMMSIGRMSPKKATAAAGGELGRKESKWRKSVLGFSDKSLSRKSVQQQQPRPAPTLAPALPTAARSRPRQQPPSSYDAYEAQQKRMAANRRSCAPTIQSRATVAAETREIKDKEQQDLADAFFCS